MRYLYSLCLYLITPVLLVMLLLRSLRAPEYRQRILERFGVLPANVGSGYIWLHSVSVGETLAAAPLVKAVQARYPQHRLLVTTMTPTGSEQVRRSFGDSVDHVYAPYDLPGSVSRFLDRTRPCLAILMETELWPNLINQCARRGLPVALINARLSQSSAQGYARFAGVSRQMMSQLDVVAAQNEADGQRFKSLGLAGDKLVITGSTKFDHPIDEAVIATSEALKQDCQAAARRPVWIAASTHQGEDEIVLQAHQKLLAEVDSALLILVPRHPERFADVARLCSSAGLNLARRSSGEHLQGDTQVLLADTMGELAALYGAADLAFVGGSLIPRGGHNLIEPAAWGLPILCGPHRFNFLDIANQLLDCGGLFEVNSAEDIASHLLASLREPDIYQTAGDSNKSVVGRNRGASERQLVVLSRLLGAP